MTEQKQDHGDTPHLEQDTIVSNIPIDPEKAAEEKRKTESHQFTKDQVKYSRNLRNLTFWLVIGTFCGTAIGIWQAFISQTSAKAAQDAANAARSAAKTATDSLKLTRDIFQASQVAVFDPEVLFAFVPTPILRLALTNVGTVPAKNVTGTVTIIYFNALHVLETRSTKFQRLAVPSHGFVQPWIRLADGFRVDNLRGAEVRIVTSVTFNDGIDSHAEQTLCKSAYFEGPTSQIPLWEDCQDRQHSRVNSK